MTSLSTFNSWVFGVRPNAQARLRLFCFPHAGGGASFFRSWIGTLPPDIEVCPVQLPGRENRLKERPFNQYTLLIQTLAQALRPYLTIPFAFFGHSMGALVSFGLARQLRQQNDPLPMHLFVSAYRAPQIPNTEPPLHLLPEPEFVKTLLGFNGTKQEVLENDELREFLLPILRADFAVCETYNHVAGEPLACPITVFGGLHDKRVKRDALAAWQEQTSGRFMLRMLPGDHFFLQDMRVPLLRLIAQDLMQRTTSYPARGAVGNVVAGLAPAIAEETGGYKASPYGGQHVH